MSNIILLQAASQGTPGKTGDPAKMDGSSVVISIRATSYGTDGKVVMKASEDGTNFTTLEDPATSSGLAEYSADIMFNVDRLAQGWTIRADLVITTGTATGLKVTMGTN